MVAPTLTILERSNLIRLAQTRPEVEYLFRHALIHNAAYSSLVKTDRRMLHLAVGQALERLKPDQAEALAPQLGQHFWEAGDEERALRYFTLAGDSAFRKYANAEAIMHYTRAQDIARRRDSPREQLIHLFLNRGRALELNSQDAQALASYEEMESVARERGDRTVELAALTARSTVYLKPSDVGNPPEGYALAMRALSLARELGDRQAEAKALWNLMTYHIFTGPTEEALRLGEGALELARELGLREQAAYILNDIHSIYYQTGHPKRAWASLEEAQQLWRELGSLNMLADSLASAAVLHIFAGEFDRALALSQEALRISQSIGNLWNQSYSWYMIDLVYLERGEFGRAMEVALECLRLAEQAGFTAGQFEAHIGLAMLSLEVGAYPLGIEQAKLALPLAEELLPTFRPAVEALLAHLHALEGDMGEAEAALEKGLSALEKANPESALFVAWFVVQLAVQKQDWERVLQVAEQALSELARLGAQLFSADLLHAEGIALRGQGQLGEAQAKLVEARAAAEAIGSRRMLWRILATLSRLEAAQGQLNQAEALRRQAQGIVEYIADHCPPDLRESFLALPDVREVRLG